MVQQINLAWPVLHDLCQCAVPGVLLTCVEGDLLHLLICVLPGSEGSGSGSVDNENLTHTVTPHVSTTHASSGD